jgi:hypothetical protein
LRKYILELDISYNKRRRRRKEKSEIYLHPPYFWEMNQNEICTNIICQNLKVFLKNILSLQLQEVSKNSLRWLKNKFVRTFFGFHPLGIWLPLSSLKNILAVPMYVTEMQSL